MIKRCPRPHSISRAFVCNFHPPARANPRPSFCPYIPKRGFFYHSRLSLSSSLSPLSLRPHAHSVRFVPSTSLPSTTTAPPFRPPKMKFLVPLALLVAAGVSADDKTGGDSKSGCLADYIVTNCLASETKKAEGCAAADWDCMCAAYEAIATCYNNCPNDPRAGPARQQVSTYCANASLYGSKAMASKTATGSVTSSAAVASASATDASSSISGTEIFPTKTTTGASAAASKTNAAEPLAGNAGGLFVAVAGAVAALL
ncbi:hypothetical protein ACCO45_005971 [Purpureocillium lilacinum]|uniref:Uncharacterized protein n=1 Tax=Purpureocillium lilacinum TaxID=33203 RepID=A0ACC4DZ88_PURLI